MENSPKKYLPTYKTSFLKLNKLLTNNSHKLNIEIHDFFGIHYN